MTVIGAPQRARQRHQSGISVRRNAFNGGSARIAKAHDLGALVESLAGGIIHGGAVPLIDPRRMHGQKLCVSA